MSDVIEIDFRNSSLKTLRNFGGERVRFCIMQLVRSPSYEAAQELCSTMFPRSEIYSSESHPDGSWTVSIRFDNLLHEGGGQSEMQALVDCLLRIADIVRES